MTPQTTVILIGLIIFIALEFLLLSFAMFAWKRSNHELPADFKWPDEVELRYTDDSGEVVAGQVYEIKRPN
jgi:hypothetical protein